MIRIFCSTVFIFNQERTHSLFLHHNKLNKWMPPGGKLDPNELPDDAAVRECLEETGILIELLGEKPPIEGNLVRPFGIQVNEVAPGKVEHVDFIYLAIPKENSTPTFNKREASQIKWFPVEEIVKPEFDSFPTMKEWVSFLKIK